MQWKASITSQDDTYEINNLGKSDAKNLCQNRCHAHKKEKKVVIKLHFLPQRRLKEIDRHIQNARDYSNMVFAL